MNLGIDASALFETLEAGAKYYVNKKEVEPLSFLHEHNGVDILRLRVWIDPYGDDGNPYGGGTVDLSTFLYLAKLGKEKGYSILVDFHYSDFWCDPAKQPMPKGWVGLSLEQLVKVIASYTKDVLFQLKKEKIPVCGIQIGNEITNGMLWPIGKLEWVEGKPRSGYDSLCALLKSASIAAREIFPEAKRVIHLERSYDQKVYQEFFEQMNAHEVPFEVIGMSYYPYWHGSFDMLFANVELMKKLYHKPIWIVETSYGFSEEPTKVGEESWPPLVSESLFSDPAVSRPYPLTQDGQADFLKELLRLSSLHEVEAVFYWEPLWLAKEGLCWATEAGQDYINEHRTTHNEWANQCLFDYEGEATKGLFAFSKN